MYKLCKTEQSARRQQLLEQGLLEAMRHKRYEEISISDLCDQIGVPRKSFYRYFSGKDGALHSLMDHRLLEFQKTTGIFARSIDEVTEQCTALFAHWRQEKVFLDAVEKSELGGVLVQRAIRQARQEYLGPNSPEPGTPENLRDHAVSFVICGLMFMVLRWHRAGFQESVEEMASIAAKMLTQPLLTATE